MWQVAHAQAPPHSASIPGTPCLIAVSITVDPGSASIVSALPVLSVKVILTMREFRPCPPDGPSRSEPKRCPGRISRAHSYIWSTGSAPGRAWAYGNPVGQGGGACGEDKSAGLRSRKSNNHV